MRLIDVLPFFGSIALSLLSVLLLVLRIWDINRSQKRYVDYSVGLLSIAMGVFFIADYLIYHNMPGKIASYFFMNIATGGSLLIWLLSSKKQFL